MRFVSNVFFAIAFVFAFAAFFVGPTLSRKAHRRGDESEFVKWRKQTIGFWIIFAVALVCAVITGTQAS